MIVMNIPHSAGMTHFLSGDVGKDEKQEKIPLQWQQSCRLNPLII
jgi:hypothetical protein